MQAEGNIRLSILQHVDKRRLQGGSGMLIVVEPVVMKGESIEVIFPGELRVLSARLDIGVIVIAQFRGTRNLKAQAIVRGSLAQIVPIRKALAPQSIVDGVMVSDNL